ncbi:hypothetical protein CDAR_376581 [Caerostris darwini]|uniref:Uncharacterized protein n=1 Tax=Caerostris darwini TaxID=1538125 RepID=A0AAV4R8A1_9ARAC|nr:hypothetical protein CDAR_376581 [Caerostris darwini]
MPLRLTAQLHPPPPPPFAESILLVSSSQRPPAKREILLAWVLSVPFCHRWVGSQCVQVMVLKMQNGMHLAPDSETTI